MADQILKQILKSGFMDYVSLAQLFIAAQAVFSFLIILILLKPFKRKAVSQPQELETVELKEETSALENELIKMRQGSSILESRLEQAEKKKIAQNEEIARLNSQIIPLEEELSKERAGRIALEDKLKGSREVKEDLADYRLIEKRLKEKNDTVEMLEKEKNELISNLRELQEKLAVIEKKNQPPVIKKVKPKSDKHMQAEREDKKKRIGDILVAREIITEDILQKAQEYQKKSGCGLTQYLLHYGYLDESQLAECICTQFGIPYLPLESYDIPEEIIKLIPSDIAQKFWLIPVDKQGDTIMLVMADPLDNKAINSVEELTGFKVIPFVGIISEIAAALEAYYKAIVYADLKNKKYPPFFIDTVTYKGIERRRSVRYNAQVDIRFPVGDSYQESKTINLSREGFAFLSSQNILAETILPLEINLPQDFTALPLSAIVQVIRSHPLADGNFEINAKTIKIAKQDQSILVEYASIHCADKEGLQK